MKEFERKDKLTIDYINNYQIKYPLKVVNKARNT